MESEINHFYEGRFGSGGGLGREGTGGGLKLFASTAGLGGGAGGAAEGGCVEGGNRLWEGGKGGGLMVGAWVGVKLG